MIDWKRKIYKLVRQGKQHRDEIEDGRGRFLAAWRLWRGFLLLRHFFFWGGGGRETWSVIWKAKKGMVVFTLRLPEEGTEQ